MVVMDTPRHTGPESLLVTKSEAARILGYSRQTLERLVETGTLATVQLAPGMRPRIRRQDVLKLANRRPPGTGS